MIRRVLLLALLAPCAAAGAQETVSPEAFEALSEGRTLRFEQDGQFYGAEQFFTGRRTLWQYPDGRCVYGRWYESGRLICFVYEDTPDPQCWKVSRDGEALEVELYIRGMPTGVAATLAGRDTEPLACPGPRVGS